MEFMMKVFYIIFIRKYTFLTLLNLVYLMLYAFLLLSKDRRLFLKEFTKLISFFINLKKLIIKLFILNMLVKNYVRKLY
jgi:hypothetical protein